VADPRQLLSDWLEPKKIPAGITVRMICWGLMQQAPLIVIPAGIPADLPTGITASGVAALRVLAIRLSVRLSRTAHVLKEKGVQKQN